MASTHGLEVSLQSGVLGKLLSSSCCVDGATVPTLLVGPVTLLCFVRPDYILCAVR